MRLEQEGWVLNLEERTGGFCYQSSTARDESYWQGVALEVQVSLFTSSQPCLLTIGEELRYSRSGSKADLDPVASAGRFPPNAL